MVLAEDLEPELVTKALGIFPSRSWRVGEPVDTRKLNGEPQADAQTAERGCWKAFIPTDLENEPLERQLEHWQALLEPRTNSLAELSAHGYELVIDCYFSTATTELVELPATTCEHLARWASASRYISSHTRETIIRAEKAV